MQIEYNFVETEFTIPKEKEFRSVVESIFKDFEIAPVDINYIFCTDEFLLDINWKYLDHDTYTDIITFESSHPELPADIYISIERVEENAKQFNINFITELYRVMIHGVLHLCGINDARPEEKLQMREYENLYLSKINSNENKL